MKKQLWYALVVLDVGILTASVFLRSIWPALAALALGLYLKHFYASIPIPEKFKRMKE
jgi:hypothetical protein